MISAGSSHPTGPRPMPVIERAHERGRKGGMDGRMSGWMESTGEGKDREGDEQKERK
jgi:hypothetical protein